MTHHAKAPSAGSTDGTGSARSLFRRAFATSGASSDSKGSGAPSSAPLRATLIALAALIALALIASLSFTAAPALAYSPTVEIDPPTGSYYTTAHLTGTFDPGTDGGGAECWFEDSSDGGTTWSGRLNFDCSDLSGTGPREVHIDLTGLAYATEYRARLVFSYNTVEGFSAEPIFTTNPEPAVPPVLATKATSPANVEYTRAHLSGTIDPEGGNANPTEMVPIAWHFQYSTDPVNTGWSDGPGGQIIGAAAEGNSPIDVAADLSGLSHHTAYFFRLVADYGGKPATSPEPDRSFETLEVVPPTVEIGDPGLLTDTTAHFSGHVNPNAPGTAPQDPGFDTAWSFHCTPDCPGLATPTILADNVNHSVEVNATGLEPDTSYQITLEASNAGGPASAGPAIFHTSLIAPTVKSALGASDGNGGYTLQGVVNPHNSVVTCKFVYGPNSEVDPAKYAFVAPCSPTPGEVNKPVTVEGHVTGLTPGATYHARLVVANGAGTEVTADQTFVPMLTPADTCPNEALRAENNSLALPQCRAYEQVSPPDKVGNYAVPFDYAENGSSLGYTSLASNIANSGQGTLLANYYVANRSGSGWKTIPNLNGPTGSFFTGAEGLFGSPHPEAYSADLQSSLWYISPGADSYFDGNRAYLRQPDGSFHLIGNGVEGASTWLNNTSADVLVGASADLSHVVFNGAQDTGGYHPIYGPGVYEFIGTGNDQPRRVDVDNAGNPLSECANENGRVADGDALSADAAVIFFTVRGGCGGANPAASELWARADGATSYFASASHCIRTAADLGGACNGPANAHFQGAAIDGSRAFFTTTQQLVNGDTDETNDLYACDIPLDASSPIGTANPCSSLTEVSGAAVGANVESTTRISDDGSHVYFIAQGVLADNNGPSGVPAVPGAHNLYVWRSDAVHPAGQTTFITTLAADDLDDFDPLDPTLPHSPPQATPDGHFLVFTTANSLVTTDTDEARDVYRYDAETAALVRVSTNVFGVAGNVESVDAKIESFGHHSHAAVSNDGEAIVFRTVEALSPLDGNGESDVYLWRAGHVSLITSGSVGGGAPVVLGRSLIGIDGSGKNIYFTTGQALTPSDGDGTIDVYDARIGGGFNFDTAAPCAGETCRPSASAPPPAPAPPASVEPTRDGGNIKPKKCSKGKVSRKGRCVKKRGKRHHHKQSHKPAHNRGGTK